MNSSALLGPMLRIPVLMLAILSASAVRAQEVPRFDITAMCRASPRLEASDQDTYQNCVRDETDARSQLERQWSSFDPQQREMCARETMVGGAPSYVDVLTCIQFARGNAPSGTQQDRRGPP